jgi:hypothetical protein
MLRERDLIGQPIIVRPIVKIPVGEKIEPAKELVNIPVDIQEDQENQKL